MSMAVGQWIRAGLEDSPKKNTIRVLDGVRACALLLVIWFHIYRIPRDMNVWPTQPFTDLLLNTLLFFGKYGVTLFFVLSGFLLFVPFARSLLFGQPWPSVRQFYLRRVFRILPAYYLSLILIVLLFQQGYLQPQRWKELGLFFIFFMDSSKTTFKQLNAPFWTLAIEWQFYMLLPLLVLGMRQVAWRVKQSRRLYVLIACLLVMIAWGIFTRFSGDYFVHQHPGRTVLFPRPLLDGLLIFTYGVSGKYLEDFGIGMLLSLCFVYAHHPSVAPRLRFALQKLSLWIGGVGLLSLLLMMLWAYNDSYPETWPLFNYPWLFQAYSLLSELCISLAFALCMCALLFGSTRLKRPFEWQPLRWLGMISYSLYMWHLPFLLLFIAWIQPLLTGWSPELAYVLYVFWVLAVIVPFCFLFFKWVEQPGMKLGERLCPRQRSAIGVMSQPTPSTQTMSETASRKALQRLAR